MPDNILQEPKTFRDRPINIDKTGKRKWVYARQPKGNWYTRRTLVYWCFLAFLIIAPFIKVNGQPFMKLDIVNRQFYIFGAMIWTQDTYLLAIIMAVTVVSIVLFTVAFGRLFCGWACPQTIFLEGIYRRIEYLFDGNYRAGNKHKKSAIRTFFKHLTYFFVTLFFTNVFLMWFVGPSGLREIITSPISEKATGFLFMIGISGFYYWVYAHIREQVCTMFCPYGRMQGVLLDSKSISVIYDYKRGEPRGARSEGHCIDCKSCIAVCPTGIDIRNGTQLECVNCTACIDECNIVMKRIKKPRNLIRYDSVVGVETGKRLLLNARTIAYSLVLLVLFSFLIYSVSTRPTLDVTMLRMPGTLFQQIDETTVSNMYNLKLINKDQTKKNLDIRLTNIEGEIELAGKKAIVGPAESIDAVVIIRVKTTELAGKSTDIQIGFFDGENMLESINLNFFGPEKQ